MPVTTFVDENAWYNIPNVSDLRTWIPLVIRVLGKRVSVEEREFVKRSWFGVKSYKMYTVLIELGDGEAQILNFAPRNNSKCSINHYVTSQEVAAWAMGVVAGGEANGKSL